MAANSYKCLEVCAMYTWLETSHEVLANGDTNFHV